MNRDRRQSEGEEELAGRAPVRLVVNNNSQHAARIREARLVARLFNSIENQELRDLAVIFVQLTLALESAAKETDA